MKLQKLHAHHTVAMYLTNAQSRSARKFRNLHVVHSIAKTLFVAFVTDNGWVFHSRHTRTYKRTHTLSNDISNGNSTKNGFPNSFELLISFIKENNFEKKRRKHSSLLPLTPHCVHELWNSIYSRLFLSCLDFWRKYKMK